MPLFNTLTRRVAADVDFLLSSLSAYHFFLMAGSVLDISR
jgi:hypothetical protein